ncbi:hypothetical protein I3843_01G180900 [Carya illinoinensis]|uniref:Protein kinase domain-containing protein n=2 Tax=Carya illinoinensis TaxID=32201 RepID=A0A8T1RRZ9_CARIL|nr:hypothetical protein I3760_01G185600 [Carya illinoinensis]KAG6668691.1 hypothetical protein CIPAW_01G188800 [Carya illinoinensis]KAG6670598.1 hypothetical protein I3843_Q052500 [Carya illinoinensis]KAG6732647.1 hypothetical protein I3842_01G188400 [Carya illinoinensis]KAG7996825.1 hypothetical protein I3843_01G180900 [Carya illinoinensis]
MAPEEEEPKRVQYPLDPISYKIIDEIGVGASAIVYKAICVPMNSMIVAIKAIDLDQLRASFDDFRREAKTMSLLSHPNILNAYCSFTVQSRLWVVMPFMSAGSLQSIISSSFPDGLTEPCIAIVLKEILNALSYLHNQGHLHRDIKAGNILLDSNGSVKLADFGVSASIYESNPTQEGSSSSSLMLTDVAGTPYWMAPEVVHSHSGYSFKADIWSFGITALELAHGRPPLSHLPPSKSLLLKITRRFRFADYEKQEKDKNKKFSKAFKDMVASCLDQDPVKRPSAEKLLKHSFFKNCKSCDFLVKNVLHELPSVEERFKERKAIHAGLTTKNIGDDDDEEEEDDGEGDSARPKTKQRRISGWNLNEDGFELEPVFPTESQDDSVVRQVRFGGETIIQDKQEGEAVTVSAGELIPSSSGHVVEETQGVLGGPISQRKGKNVYIGEGTEVRCGTFDKEAFLAGLFALKSSLDEQRAAVCFLIGQYRHQTFEDMSCEEQMALTIQRLKVELENERSKNIELERELEYFQLQLSGAF